MKILKTIVKGTFSFGVGALLASMVVSCGTTKVAPAPSVEPQVEEQPVEAPQPEVQNEVAAEAPTVAAEVDDEYSRSVGDIGVSRDTFEDDKTKILRIIDELAGVMKDMDYKRWLTYVDNESIQYWQQPANLKKAQNRLPVKGLKLKNLQDYFKYVFVPARSGRTVTEIRYISDTYTKAIQVREKQDDVVYYYFNKIDGFWMVHLPPIEN